METFVCWEVSISMRVEWKCVSMTSGGQCVMTTGIAMMLLWSAGNLVIVTAEVSFFSMYLHSFGIMFLKKVSPFTL